LVSDLVEDAIGVERQLPDGLVVELRYYPTHAGQFIEDIGLRRDILRDLPGVVAGDVGNDVMVDQSYSRDRKASPFPRPETGFAPRRRNARGCANRIRTAGNPAVL
jgi:hypothetical protein